MTDADIVCTLAEKVMGWEVTRITTWRKSYMPRRFPQLAVTNDARTVLWMDDESGHTDLTWNPLSSISDMFTCLERGEWDYIIRKSRGRGIYTVFVVNSYWCINHPGDVPEDGSPELYGRGDHEKLERAGCLALIAAVEGR